MIDDAPTPPPSWKDRLATPRNAILLAGVLAFGFLRFVHADITDDAYITFVYARNLVLGRGFVFNPGEVVYGTTAPLFGLFAAAGIALGFKPWTWVLAFDVLWQGAILWRLRQLMELTGGGRWFPLALAVLLWASLDTLPVAGMETGPYLLAILSSLVALTRGERPAAAVGWAVLAACIRPDGAVILGVACAFGLGPLAMKRDVPALLRAAWPLAGLVAFGALVLVLFGTIVPHSMQAKRLATSHAPFEALLAFDLVRFFTGWFGKPQWLAFAGLGAFAWHGWRRGHWPLTAFVVLYAAFFVVGRAPRFVWYMTPLMVIWYAWSARGVGEALAALAARFAPKLPRAVVPVAAVLATALLFGHQARIYHIINAREAAAPGIRTDLKGYRAAAEYMRTATPEGVPLTVAAQEVGTLGWFLDGEIFDIEGLVTTRALEFKRAGRWDDLFAASGATWAVHPYWRDGEDAPGEDPLAAVRELPHFQSMLAQGYRAETAFDCPVDRWRTVVFRRVENP
jgi:hypothetical protein